MSGAIPTFGPKGIRFRSRLEARWAWTFDALRWDWHYEPIDLKGYIPDFIVTIDARKVLFEIKGTVGMHEEATYKPHVDKIIQSGWDGYYVAVGADPTAMVRLPDGRVIYHVDEGKENSSMSTTSSTLDTIGATPIASPPLRGLPIIGTIGHTTTGLTPRPCAIGVIIEGKAKVPITSMSPTNTTSSPQVKWILLPKRELGEPGASYDRFAAIWTMAQNASQWKPPTVPSDESIDTRMATIATKVVTRDDLDDLFGDGGGNKATIQSTDKMSIVASAPTTRKRSRSPPPDRAARRISPPKYAGTPPAPKVEPPEEVTVQVTASGEPSGDQLPTPVPEGEVGMEVS